MARIKVVLGERQRVVNEAKQEIRRLYAEAKQQQEGGQGGEVAAEGAKKEEQ